MLRIKLSLCDGLVIDLFLSFVDTFVERNALMVRVYPRLKSFCQERGYDFQVVDMRWGVRDESTDDHMTTELCMRELRACQKLSTGPNFIVSTKLVMFIFLASCFHPPCMYFPSLRKEAGI